MSKPIEIDWQTRQQIAVIAGIAGAIASVIIALSAPEETRMNPLVIGVVGWVISIGASLISRKLGVGIILLTALLILRSCGTSQGS